MQKNYDEFMEAYTGTGRLVIHVHPDETVIVDPTGFKITIPTVDQNADEPATPFVVFHGHEGNTALVNPILGLIKPNEYLDLDVHAFRGATHGGEDATLGVFGMANGSRFKLEDTGTKSAGWNSANLIALFVGEQE